MTNKTNNRIFSYNRGIRYGDNTYPSSDATLVDENGQQWQGPIFADANSQYYTMQNGKAVPVMPVHTLDEVTVTAPKKHKTASDYFGDYLTMSNDATKVFNTPHRDYNTHLAERAIRGAQSHAAWEQEHPNLAAWSYAAGAAPFVVASAPLVAGVGDALASSAIGQGITNGLGLVSNAASNSTWLPWLDAAATSYFGAHGLQDIANGNFTPETALEVAPLMQMAKPVYNAGKGIVDTEKASTIDNIFAKIKNDWPLKGETEIPLEIKAEEAKKYIDFINGQDYQNRLQRANLEDHWNYMKNLTDRRLNNNGYFPGKVKAEIENDPNTVGLSVTDPSDPDYGITLQEDLSAEEVPNVLMHEIAHWATGNAGTNDAMNSAKYPFKHDYRVNYIGDIMRHNESIVPNIPWDDILQDIPKSTPIKEVTELEERYRYLTDPQEKRARAMSIYQQAKDNNISTDDFVDRFTDNGRITKDAPMALQQLDGILTIDNIKKYLRDFLSITPPIGVATYKNE